MKKSVVITLFALCILSLLGHALVYPSLLPLIPTHWGLSGEVDASGPRWMDLLLAALPLVLWAMALALPRIDPRRGSYAKHARAYSASMAGVVLLLVALSWVTAATALGWAVDVGTVVCLLVGALLLVVGNYLPQVRPNYTFGIRTPWTLDNEQVWRRTHRLGGVLFCINGLLFLLCSPLPGILLKLAPVLFSLVMAAGLALYSYCQHRKI